MREEAGAQGNKIKPWLFKNRIKEYMNEDDTIRILKRIPFHDMMKLYRSGAGPKFPHNAMGEWDAFLATSGWTWQEFARHWKEWNGGLDTY